MGRPSSPKMAEDNAKLKINSDCVAVDFVMHDNDLETETAGEEIDQTYGDRSTTSLDTYENSTRVVDTHVEMDRPNSPKMAEDNAKWKVNSNCVDSDFVVLYNDLETPGDKNSRTDGDGSTTSQDINENNMGVILTSDNKTTELKKSDPRYNTITKSVYQVRDDVDLKKVDRAMIVKHGSKYRDMDTHLFRTGSETSPHKMYTSLKRAFQKDALIGISLFCSEVCKLILGYINVSEKSWAMFTKFFRNTRKNSIEKGLFDRFWIVTSEMFENALSQPGVLERLSYIMFHPDDCRLPVQIPVFSNSFLGQKVQHNTGDTVSQFIANGVHEIMKIGETLNTLWNPNSNT